SVGSNRPPAGKALPIAVPTPRRGVSVPPGDDQGGIVLRHKRLTTLSVAFLAVLLLAACSSNNSPNGGGNGNSGGASFNGVPLTGAGSTFAAPIYDQWRHDFHSVESNADINYQAIGSGGGVEQFTKQTIDFGATDAPLQKDQISALPTGAVEIPTMLGGVVFAYNVPGLATGLKLDGTTAADIFLGNVTSWNDP